MWVEVELRVLWNFWAELSFERQLGETWFGPVLHLFTVLYSRFGLQALLSDGQVRGCSEVLAAVSNCPWFT